LLKEIIEPVFGEHEEWRKLSRSSDYTTTMKPIDHATTQRRDENLKTVLKILPKKLLVQPFVAFVAALREPGFNPLNLKSHLTTDKWDEHE
jgi:hypothetical protein